MPNALCARWKPLPQPDTGTVKELKGPLKGRYRLRVGKWRIFFSFEPPDTVVVIDVENRGQAY